MKLGTVLTLTVLAASAITGVSAPAAALANEGPFYKVAGKRLEAKGNREVKGKLAKEFVLTAGTREVDCKKLKLEKSMIFGSNGPNASEGEWKIVFEECGVLGNGASCSVTGGKVETNLMEEFLAFANKASKKGETLLIMLKPEKGQPIATIKFSGTCTSETTNVEGVVAAEAWNSEEKPVKLEETEKEGVSVFANFPTAQIKAVWIEEAGLRREVATSLTMFGQGATIVGRAQLSLPENEQWGIFAK